VIATSALLMSCAGQASSVGDGGTDSDTNTETETDTDTSTGMDLETCGDETFEHYMALTSQASVDGYPGYTWIQNIFEIGPQPWEKGPAPTFNDITDLGPLSELRCAEQFTVVCNELLADLEGLDNLTAVGGMLVVYNEALTTLLGLESLVWVEDELEIDSHALVDVDGLSGLIHVGGILYIHDNDLLESLTGLSNLESVGDDGLRIRENPALPTCEAIALRDQLYAAGWDGPVCIQYNLADECEDDTSDC
jgi:hypothetical protein